MKGTASARVVIAPFVGAFYGWMAVNFWGGYAANSSINDWLLSTLAEPGYEASYLVAIYAHDIVVNVLLAVPVAAVLVAFRSLNDWPNLIIAVAMGVVVSFWNTHWGSFPLLLSSWGFWLGFGMSVWSLPIAFAGIRALRRSSASAA